VANESCMKSLAVIQAGRFRIKQFMG